MKSCPHCGGDLSAPKRLVATSAKDLVESLQLDIGKLSWCVATAPDIDPIRELESFKIAMRACGYRLSSGRGGPVKDAWAAFQTRMENAVRFAKPRTDPAKPQRTVAPRKDV